MTIRFYASMGMAAVALVSADQTQAQERRNEDRSTCFHSVNIDWGEAIEEAERETIFVNILIKIGLIGIHDNRKLVAVDHFDYSSFTVAQFRKCSDIDEVMKKEISYAFEHSQGPYGYGGQVSDINFNVTNSPQNRFVDRLSKLSYEKTLKENFIGITGMEEFSSCTVRLSFPKPNQEINVSGYELEKSRVYEANYLYYSMDFFRFPFLISAPFVYYDNTEREKGMLDYYYIIYHDDCNRRVEMTRTLMRWANDLVGVPFDIEGVEVSGHVSEREIDQVFGNL